MEEKKAADRERERRRDQNYAVNARESSVAGAEVPVPEEASSTLSGQPTGLDALVENRIMATAERDLLNFILTYGTTKLEFQSDSDFYSGSNEDARTVFDFIDLALEEDKSSFVNTVFKDVYEAYSKDYYEGYPQEEIVRHLMDGEDRKVAYVAAQLSTDERYDLSIKNLRQSMMSKGSWLTIYVPKAILVFQQCRLENRDNDLKERLRAAQNASDPDLTMEIMQEMLRVQKALKLVKIRLGRDK